MTRMSSLAVLLIVPTILLSQAPSIQIKVREKSGFLGMGGPQSIELRLSNRQQTVPLNDNTVNSDSHYIFLCRAVGDWELDADFIEEDLGNLSVTQSGRTMPIVWKSEFAAEDTSILLGFSKQLRLNEPLLFIFPFNGTADSVTMRIPMELWPGFSGYRDLITKLNDSVTGRRDRESIRLCEQILRQPMFAIFPSFAEVRSGRTQIFQSYYDTHWGTVRTLAADPGMDLKTKIARLDSAHPVFEFIRDSLPNPSLNITVSDSSIARLLEHVRSVLAWIGTTRDSLQKVLDEQNVRWILEGSVSGRNGFLYQTILEALAYAFSSLDFSDTAVAAMQFSISEERRADLAKNNLTDSYETFLRLTVERYAGGKTLFTPEFLDNVRRDTASFRLPFYSMLSAVNDFYASEFDSARAEIFRIFRVSYDPDISARYDDMRIMIQVREGRFSPEAIELLEEARRVERSDPDAAGEMFRRAAVVAPNFAYASFALGNYYARQGDPIRAQTFFVRAYETDTLYLSAYRESFNLYRRTGNYKPMIQVLTLAINKGNDYWETQSNLGLAYMGDGDPARAIQHYERALAINPQSYTTNIQLGLAYQTVKNYQRAREYFNSAINIDPLRQEAVEYLTRLNELQRSGK